MSSEGAVERHFVDWWLQWLDYVDSLEDLTLREGKNLDWTDWV